MPPADADDANLSIRFKYGIHTIFLFVDGLAPFSSVTEKLLEVLRERYPDGLIKSKSSPEEKTPIPDSPNVLYGVLPAGANPARGWKALNIGEDAQSTPADCGLKENSAVAFAFAEEDEMTEHVGDDAKMEFIVEWPQEDVDID